MIVYLKIRDVKRKIIILSGYCEKQPQGWTYWRWYCLTILQCIRARDQAIINFDNQECMATAAYLADRRILNSKEIKMDKQYPAYFEKLNGLMMALGKEIPGPMSGFNQLHKTAMVDGALSAKTKELIALAIAITVRCDGCIAYHVHDALQSGATRPEIVESIGVAVLMGGGPSAIYGSEALEALEQFEAQIAS